MNQDLQKASEKFECKIQNLEQLFEKGKTIDSIESFRHHASVWYELGYTVGKLEGGKVMDELIKSVEQWSIDKGLDRADSAKQFLKVSEEVGEVSAALARNDRYELKDGIGDVVVTLIILAQQNGMTLHECLNQAYTEIAGRKGKMVDGIFVKESDLK